MRGAAPSSSEQGTLQSLLQRVVAVERVGWWDRRGSEVAAGRDAEESCLCFAGAPKQLRSSFTLGIVGHLMAVAAASLETSWCLQRAFPVVERREKPRKSSLIGELEWEMQILPVKLGRKRP